MRKLGTVAQYRKYKGVGHGFGLGAGMSAESCILEALRFWEEQIARIQPARERRN